jgi:hypothetical protein
MHWSCAYRLDKAEIGSTDQGRSTVRENNMNDVDRVEYNSIGDEVIFRGLFVKSLPQIPAAALGSN